MRLRRRRTEPVPLSMVEWRKSATAMEVFVYERVPILIGDRQLMTCYEIPPEVAAGLWR